MVDFLTIGTKSSRKGVVEVYPKFKVGKSNDLMIRGGDFYAIWLEDRNLWSKDEQDVITLVDKCLDDFAKANKDKYPDQFIKVSHMWEADSGIIDDWHKFCQKQLRDNYVPLDEKLIFSNQQPKKEDYASKTLPYPLEEGSTEAFDELIDTLYSEDERHKIEWAIGSVVNGASKTLQKFVVLYGASGTGKSTVLNIIQKLFDGYCSVFDAKALGSSTNVFALEAFKNNPLVAIQHDGDLSRIEDNTTLNSLVSHETMVVNEKHKSLYTTHFNSFLFMGTNKPVKITDGKSGILRRLIDVKPTGNRIPQAHYKQLMKKIDFELGAIAYECKKIFEEDPYAYDEYVPQEMLSETNDFYNFVLDSYQIFKKDDGVTLKVAWEMYKTYCDDAKVLYPFSMRVFKTELKNYFENYEERAKLGEDWVRSYYSGFKHQIFEKDNVEEVRESRLKNQNAVLDTWLNFKDSTSDNFFQDYAKDMPAQYATTEGTPKYKWENVKTKLKDIDASKLHYLKVPSNLIVIDFDIKGADGKKNFGKNLEEASKWPATYAEISQGGQGIHLHYIYDGDVEKLNRLYSDDIEIKVFTGNSSLRRRLSKCVNLPISKLSSGLPLKEKKKMVDFETINSEKALRTIILKNLKKEYHGATKPSMDFIYKVTEECYESGMKYDISDMYNSVLAFAAGSTHQSDYCLKLLSKIHFKSDENSQSTDDTTKPLIFLDCEVFPNLLLVCWKKEGANNNVNGLFNPKPIDIEKLINQYRIVGFNNRKYDNHILYACMIGYNNEQIYNLSQRIIDGQRNALFGEAYNISYTDIYDYCSASNKMSLKKWEIKLKIHHKELGFPWDEPVPEEKWQTVFDYCKNDVVSTEAVWNATKDDFLAREILADITGMSVNDTTNMLTTKLIFGNEKHPQLVYTDLSKEFPGYEFVKEWNEKTGKFDRHNMYRGVDLGFGGYVYSEPGMYGNVALLDVASLHPHSIIALNLFGEYTKNFKDLVDLRIEIKHKDYSRARTMFNGKLNKYLDNVESAKNLAKALKTAINSVYGLTSANFANPFRDPNNENNIVALRGALFMKTLQDEVVAKGFKVVHIKTDSIKIPDATPEIIKFCMDFANKYGYDFEHEATYDRICLVNDSVYIAKYATEEQCKKMYGYSPDECTDNGGKWTATGTQFQVPYVFKKCFSHENIDFSDLCETKEVKTAIYLDMNEGLPEGERNLKFVGKVGLFCPIKDGKGGGELVKSSKKKDGTVGYDAVVGTKGYRWLESEDVYTLNKQKDINTGYYDNLVNEAIEEISKHGDYTWFVSDDPYCGPLIVNGRPDYEGDILPF